MGAKVTARTSDGTLLEFEAADGETILDAAAGAGSTLVSLCRKGTCGVCRVRLVTGDVNHTVHTPEAPSSAEEKSGDVLACCALPVEDVSVDLPYDRSRMLDGAVPERIATVTAIDRWPGDVVRLSRVPRGRARCGDLGRGPRRANL